MKVLWVSNSPWSATGYGTQTRLFVPRIARDHKVALAANYGLQGDMMEWEGFRVYPTGLDSYSNDVIPAHARHWFAGEAGLVITLYDVWALKAPEYRGLDIAAWTPVDHNPTPPRVREWFTKYGAVPIAMSRFGQAQLEADGVEAHYVPHGVDTEVFVPHPKAESKQRIGLDPDRFVVGMVSTNKGRYPSRKAFAETFLAFAYLHRKHPDTLLYVHSDMNGQADGVQLDVLAQACGIPPEALLFADQYAYRLGLPDEAMAVLYSAFDILCFATMGEGFGIPAIEAQAAGTPVIVTDFTAQPELVAPDAGYAVPCQPSWDHAQGSFFATPLISGIADALDHAYANSSSLAAASIKCREFALGYDAETVHSAHWKPLLDTLAAQVDGAPIKATEL